MFCRRFDPLPQALRAKVERQAYSGGKRPNPHELILRDIEKDVGLSDRSQTFRQNLLGSDVRPSVERLERSPVDTFAGRDGPDGSVRERSPDRPKRGDDRCNVRARPGGHVDNSTWRHGYALIDDRQTSLRRCVSRHFDQELIQRQVRLNGPSIDVREERRINVAGHRRHSVVVHRKKIVQARRHCLVQAHGNRHDGVALPGKPALKRRRCRYAFRDRSKHSVLLKRLPDDEIRASVTQPHALHFNVRRRIP